MLQSGLLHMKCFRRDQLQPLIATLNVYTDPVRSAGEPFRRGLVMEHELVEQVTVGHLARGESCDVKVKEVGSSQCDGSGGCASYLAHGIARCQRVGEEQVTVRPQDPVAPAAAA